MSFFPQKNESLILLVAIFLGLSFRFYGLSDPWKRKDHYNFGGVYTTYMVHCMKKMPLEESLGRVHTVCTENDKIAYPNHPPTYIFAMSAWTQIFGQESERAIRLFDIFFSLLNVGLIYLLVLHFSEDKRWALLAAFIHSLSVGTLYFGSHADFINEFAVFWTLLAYLFCLKGKENWSGFFAVMAGLTEWPGFFVFAGIILYKWLNKKSLLRTFLWASLGAVLGLALMMWLQQKLNVYEFLKFKLTRPGYVGGHERDYLYIFRWIYGQIQYWNNWLSPLFFYTLILGLLSLFKSTSLGEKFINKKTGSFFALLSSAGFLYMALGNEFFYVHIFLLGYLAPAMSIFIAYFLKRLLFEEWTLHISKSWLWGIGTFVICTYTYGRYMSSMVHDVINSLGFVATTFTFIYLLSNRKINSVVALFAIAGIFNISQMTNYRNEPALDYDFCLKARQEYQKTGQPVQATLDKFFTRDLYCQGVPLIEPAN